MTDSQVLNMPTKLVNFIDNDPGDDFEGFFSLMELFAARKIVPVPAQMLQLIALVVNPMLCLRSQVPASHSDPMVLSGNKISWQAWSFLDSFFKTGGPSSFLRCLPGYNHANLLNLEVISKDKLKNSDSPSFIRRLVDPPNIWGILLTTLDDSSAQPTVTPGAWDLLALLVSAWEIDFKTQGVPETHTTEYLHASLSLKPAASDLHKTCLPHFLRQLTEAPAGGFRIDNRVYDIIFQPFYPTCNSPTYPWGVAINSLTCAQELSMRLLHLLDRLDTIQLLETGRLREDIVIRMRGLETPDLHVFVNSLPEDHLLRTRLLSRFLESITRSPSTGQPGAVVSISQSTPSNLSPHRTGINGATGLRRTPSRTALKLDDRPTEGSCKTQLLSLCSLITQLLPRELLDIPTTARRSTGTNKLDIPLILNAEARYLSVLNVILGSLFAVYHHVPAAIDLHGLALIKQGKLRTAIHAIFDAISLAIGSKLDPRSLDLIRRNRLHRKLDRSINAFEILASKPIEID